MTKNGFLLKFFDKQYILKTFYLILFVSFFLIIDIYIALRLSRYISGYLLMFFLSISGFAGLVIGFIRVKSMLHAIMKEVDKGNFNIKSMYSYFGSIFACILLIVPGFLTDIIGVIILFSVLKTMTGKLILGAQRENLKSLYEYLKLY